MIIAAMPCDTFGKVVYSSFTTSCTRCGTRRSATRCRRRTRPRPRRPSWSCAAGASRWTRPRPRPTSPRTSAWSTRSSCRTLADQKIGLTRPGHERQGRRRILDGMVDYGGARARARAPTLSGMKLRPSPRDYGKFVPIASKTVEQMLDPKNIAEKAAIMEKAQMKPETTSAAAPRSRSRPTSSRCSTSSTPTTAASSTRRSSRRA